MAMTQPKDDDHRVTIVLLGVTGAGKSTFTAMASGREVKIGHGVDPCTQDPLAVQFELKDQTIVLVDTPGFDDDARSDVEILRDIAEWLGKEGHITKERPLDGLILLHPATHTAVSGNERKRARLLEKILGDDAYSRVVIATTMWENLGPDDSMGIFGGRDRVGKNGVWDSFHRKGATITKHDNTPESAHRIIDLITSKSRKGTKARTLLSDGLATPLSEELRAQLEEDVDLAWRLLKDHGSDRIPKEWKRSKDEEERQRYKLWEKEMRDDWRRENRELQKKLEMQQKKLKKMDSIIVSSGLPIFNSTLEANRLLTFVAQRIGR